MSKSKHNIKFQHNQHKTNGLQKIRSNDSQFSGDGTSDEKSPVLEDPATQAEEQQKKRQSIITRTIWSLAMIAFFFVSLFSGHIYMIIIITAIQIISFKEVTAISNVPSRARSLRFTKTISWYFLGVTMYFLYGESVIYYFKHVVLVDKILLPFSTHHRFISMMLYMIGFVFFVTSLQKGHYKFQFTQFAWTHMALYLIVVQAHFVMNNILEGMFWLFLPAALVITNDIWAYICGMTFGRTPLIQLSPKKTVEGFVGAWFFTLFFGFIFTHYLTQYSYFICPVTDLGANIFTGLNCTPNPVFLQHTYSLPYEVPSLPFIGRSITIAPIHFHVLVMGTFASLIAPFGGFFASGLKRTFKVKDFGDSIPGHGGILDRFDCQFLMGFYAFVHRESFISEVHTSVGAVIEMAISGLSADEMMDVVRGLSQHLVNQGVIGSEVLESIKNQLHR